MPIRSVSDFVYTMIAWFPFLLVPAIALFLMIQGLIYLEINSVGTEIFLKNDQSVQHWNKTDVQNDQAARAQMSAFGMG